MELEIDNVWKIVMTIGIGVIIGSLASLYRLIVMKPKWERLFLKKQGISGPPPLLLLGNLLDMKTAIDAAEAEAAVAHKHPSSIINHNMGPFIFPFIHQWIKQYGEAFAFSLGVKTVVHVTKPAFLKEIITMTSFALGRPTLLAKELAPLMGHGILASNGPHWANQRKLFAPHFQLNKIKEITNMIIDSSIMLTESWVNKIKIEGGAIDINIDGDLRTFSGDVVSKFCFGSNYHESKDILLKVTRLEEVTSNLFVALGIPGLRFTPTRKNLEAWALEKEVYKLIMNIMHRKKELKTTNFVVASAKNSDLTEDESNKFVVDNIKDMYLAGYLSTASVGSLCLMLLALNPEWQIRVRNEVAQVCKGQIPTADMLLQMKELTMVIYETMRLYSPAPLLGREVLSDMKIGGVNLVKGMQIWSHVYLLHTDPENWGPDSYKFNPQRFANGVVGACKSPQFYMPFGVGTRMCLGQHLALTEIRALISSIVANFTFSLSSNYVYAFNNVQVVFPKFGVNLVIDKL